MKKTVIVFTGAGISADSGISTFRSDNGLWDNFSVDDVASIDGFKRNPQLVWDFYKARHDQLKTVTFNTAHSSLVNLQNKIEHLGFNFLLITQNVDRLHQSAGSRHVNELHGNLVNVKCDVCDFVDTTEEYWECNLIPHCPKCKSYLRPDIVWFGEVPSIDTMMKASVALEDCRSIFVIGTSLQVYPAADIVHLAVRKGAVLFESNLQCSPFLHNYTMNYINGRAVETVPQLCNMVYNSLLSDIGK